ncbi:helix-turn-helix transcriptional regulator [Xanthobacter pseudotagetidis]|uniref:helix-turn-helix transcriptional regulator n=1 Tax=Xanthobacter pseudotagetidis TaxID=3119911 RepID=UPI0037275A33
MTDTDAATRLRFRTEEVPENIRMAFVREHFARTMIGLDIEPDPQDRLRIEVDLLRLPDVTVARGTSSALTSSRSALLLADGNDDIAISRLATRFRLAAPGRPDIDLKPGDVAALNLGDRLAMEVGMQADFWTIQISRPRLARLLPRTDDVHLRPLQRTDPIVEMLFGYAGLVAGLPPLAEARRLASDHLAELAALALSPAAERRGSEPSGVRAARRAAAREQVHAALDRPNLSAVSVAARLGISTRYVQLLFEEDGESFSVYVTRLRLERVRRLIEDPRHAHRRIADLAFEVGFRDLSTFNRQFRRRFGETPTAVRRRG